MLERALNGARVRVTNDGVRNDAVRGTHTNGAETTFWRGVRDAALGCDVWPHGELKRLCGQANPRRVGQGVRRGARP
eukprot:6448908-Prymnesium_polylepis.1